VRVENKTNYSTRALRSIFCSVHGDLPRKLPTWRRLTVTIVYAKRMEKWFVEKEDGGKELVPMAHGPTHMTGSASYNGRHMTLRLPRERVDLLWVAKLFHHEILHNFGTRHPDYPAHLGRNFWKTDAEGYRWVIEKHGFEQYLDEVVPESKAKPTIDEKRDERVQRLLQRRKAWVTKLRRAETALKKIDQSLRYYDKQGVEVPELEAPTKMAAKRKRRRRKK